MRYLRAYRFLFDGPSWNSNLLAGAACQFVPLLGQAIFTGYVFDWIEKVSQDGNRDCPRFEVDRLGTYFARGLGPLLVQLMALLPVLFIAGMISLVLMMNISGEGRQPATASRAVFGFLPLGVFAVVLLLSIPLVPLTLHVGLRQRWQGAGDFTKDFLRRVGPETLLTQLFIAPTGLSLLLIGGALCGVGVYLAAALVHCAQYHLLAQLYGLYLQRGGKAPVESLRKNT